MKSKGLVQFYDRLTPDERFRLVLEAIARGDHEEEQRLVQACPRKTYAMADGAFVDLMDGTRLAAACFTIFWLGANRQVIHRQVAKATFQLAAMAFEQGFQVGLRAAKRVPSGDHPIWQASNDKLQYYEARRDEADQQYREGVAVLKGVYHGFLRFCRAAHVEPEKLLVWHRPVLAEIEQMRDLLEAEIPADEETADVVYRRLCESWPELEVTAEVNAE